MTTTTAAPWWHTAPNPTCRPWCTQEHNPREFARGGLIVCRAHVFSELAAIDEIEVSASTSADEEPGARTGDLIIDQPEILVYLLADGRDGDGNTPEGLEALAAELPNLLEQARAIAEQEAT